MNNNIEDYSNINTIEAINWHMSVTDIYDSVTFEGKINNQGWSISGDSIAVARGYAVKN